MMSDPDRDRDDELMAIPRLAERIGVTPRVLRYWEEQQLISPTREHGKLRYSPRDLAIAAPPPPGRKPRWPRRHCGSCTSARPSARKPAWMKSTTQNAGRHLRHPRPTGRTSRPTDPEPAASPGAHSAAP